MYSGGMTYVQRPKDPACEIHGGDRRAPRILRMQKGYVY